MYNKKLFVLFTIVVVGIFSISYKILYTIPTIFASELKISTKSIRPNQKNSPANILKDEKEKSFFNVPFFSQFSDISETNWKKKGCGIVSLTMLINYYKPGEVSVDELLDEGIRSGAYIKNAGWSHKGLALLANDHSLSGKNYDLSTSNMNTAFSELEKSLKKGPVIASVHYSFDPKNPIPHLVVINGIKGNILYYNDPTETSGGGIISAEAFKLSWKKRYIEVREKTT